MGDVANKVSELVSRIVIDKTGLTGRYDFRLDLTPYMTPDTDGAKADIMSILFAGFNDQLGLKSWRQVRNPWICSSSTQSIRHRRRTDRRQSSAQESPFRIVACKREGALVVNERSVPVAQLF